MQTADNRILEVLRSDGNMTPLAVSRDGLVERVDVGKSYAGQRLRKLAQYGLVERVDRGLYGITDEGLAYLDEDLDASELEPVENNDG